MKACIIKVQRSYAFAMGEGGENIFCHGRDCDFHLGDVLPGDTIEIGSMVTDDGFARPRGIDVIWLDRPILERKLGAVDRIFDGKHFGFILTEGRNYFFHAKMLREDCPFVSLNVGDTVSFLAASLSRGLTALDVCTE